MGRKRVTVKVTLIDGRKIKASLQCCQADVLKLVHRIQPKEFTKLEIADALDPELWGLSHLDRYFDEIISHHGEEDGLEMKKVRLSGIKRKISSRIAQTKRAFREIEGVSSIEIYEGFPYYCSKGADRNVTKLHPNIESITFENSSN